MAKVGDFRVASGPGKLGHKRVGVQLLGGHGRGDFRTRQKSLTIEWREKRAALLQRAKPIQPHGIQPLEYIAVLTMLRGAAMFIGETLDFLEPGDDAFLPGPVPDLLFGSEEHTSEFQSLLRI